MLRAEPREPKGAAALAVDRAAYLRFAEGSLIPTVARLAVAAQNDETWKLLLVKVCFSL